MPREMLLPPGYLSLSSMKGVMAAKAGLSQRQTIDDVIEKGVFMCGSAKTVREKIEKYEAEIGFGTYLANLQFGTLPHDLVLKNTQIFAEEIMPHFRKRDAQAA